MDVHSTASRKLFRGLVGLNYLIVYVRFFQAKIECILNCSISCYQAFLFLKMINKVTPRKSSTKMKEIKHFAEKDFRQTLKA